MKTYLSELTSLIRSITIKSSHQAIAINNYVISKHGTLSVTSDMTTWKYYLNLNGQYHFTNTPMTLHVLELNEERELTRELLEEHPMTKADLCSFSTSYKRLVAAYPQNETLIRGMLNPIDLDLAINAVDGEILSYSNTFLDDREIDIMKKLNNYTKNMYYRWFNHLYTNVSSMYVASFLSLLYSTLETKIEMFRFQNIHTHRVSEYHMDQFFRSNLNINTEYMNLKSKLWLYQNLRTVMVHTGKEETLQQLLDNVLTPNQIGIGKLSLRKDKPNEVSSNILNPSKPGFDTSRDTQLIVEPYNQYYTTDGLSVSEIVNMEVNNRYIHESVYEDLNSLIDEVTTELSKCTQIHTNTKVLHIIGKEERDVLPFPRINLLLDTLFYLGAHSTNEFNITYLDPNTSKSYDITFDTGIKLLGYYLLKIGNMESDTLKVASKAIVKKDYFDSKPHFTLDGTKYEYVDIIQPYRPTMFNTNFNTDTIIQYINSTMSYFTVEWIIKSSLVNQLSVGNMMVFDSHNHGELITLDITNIKDNVGLEEIEGYDYMSALHGLVSTLTDGKISVDLTDVNADVIGSYVDLIRKATSYNVQILSSTIYSETNSIFDVGLGLLQGDPVVVGVMGYVNGFEMLIGELEVGDSGLVTRTEINNNKGYRPASLTESVGYATHRPEILPPRQWFLELEDVSHVYREYTEAPYILQNSDLHVGEGIIYQTRRSLPVKTGDRDFKVTGTIYGGMNVVRDTNYGELELEIK